MTPNDALEQLCNDFGHTEAKTYDALGQDMLDEFLTKYAVIEIKEQQ